MSKASLIIGHWLVIIALFFAEGGHLAVLQTVAWGTMVVEYSQHTSLGVAVEKTFDGRHPCGLCTQIQKSRHPGKKTAALVVVKKFVMFDHRVADFLPANREPVDRTAPDLSAGARFLEPSLPPPRAA